MSVVMEQYPRRASRQDFEPPRHGALDMARRRRYLALLRRWAQERLPAGTRAAHDAAEWARGVLIHAAMSDVESLASGSLLLRLRSRLLAEGAEPMRAANDASSAGRMQLTTLGTTAARVAFQLAYTESSILSNIRTL